MSRLRYPRDVTIIQESQFQEVDCQATDGITSCTTFGSGGPTSAGSAPQVTHSPAQVDSSTTSTPAAAAPSSQPPTQSSGSRGAATPTSTSSSRAATSSAQGNNNAAVSLHTSVPQISSSGLSGSASTGSTSSTLSSLSSTPGVATPSPSTASISSASASSSASSPSLAELRRHRADIIIGATIGALIALMVIIALVVVLGRHYKLWQRMRPFIAARNRGSEKEDRTSMVSKASNEASRAASPFPFQALDSVPGGGVARSSMDSIATSSLPAMPLRPESGRMSIMSNATRSSCTLVVHSSADRTIAAVSSPDDDQEYPLEHGAAKRSSLQSIDVLLPQHCVQTHPHKRFA